MINNLFSCKLYVYEQSNHFDFEPFCTEHLDLIKEAAGSEFTLQQLDAGCDENSLEDAIKTAEIIVGQPPLKHLLPAETKCPELRFIQMTWAGTDQYTQSSIPFPKDRIALANARGAYGMIISQFVICQILSLMLNFKAYHNRQQNKTWERQGPILSLQNANVLIQGLIQPLKTSESRP